METDNTKPHDDKFPKWMENSLRPGDRIIVGSRAIEDEWAGKGYFVIDQEPTSDLLDSQVAHDAPPIPPSTEPG